MATTDRYWWVGLLTWPLLAAAVVASALTFIPSYATPTTIFGITLPIPLELNVIVPASVPGVWLVVLARWVVRAARRQRLRARTLAGDVTAIPAASVVPDARRAPSVVGTPLVLQWQIRNVRRRIRVYYLFAAMGFVVFGVLFVSVGVIVTNSPSVTAAVYVVGIILSTAIFSVVAILSIRKAYTKPGTVYELVADDDGLSYYQGESEVGFVPWHAANLLEVAPHPRWSNLQEYTLYARDGSVTWTDFVLPGRYLRPPGMTAEEWAARHRALLDVIAARTRLTPRTFTPAYMPRGTGTSATHQRPGPVRSASGGAIFSVLLGALAYGAVKLPLDARPLLNAYVAGSLGVLVLVILVATAKAARNRYRAQPRALSDVPHLPPSTIPDEQSIELRYRLPPRQRLSEGLLGLLLASWLLPALLSPGSPFAPDRHGFDAPRAEVEGLLILGCFGLLAMLVACLPRRTTLRAGRDGLGEVSRTRPKYIRWDEITEISYRKKANGPEFVVRTAGVASMNWPANPALLLTPRASQSTVTGEAFCALVVKRSGVPLTVDAPE